MAGFPKKNRLLTAADYKMVFDSPDRRSSDYRFAVLAAKNGEDYSRLGMAIAKKRVKKAVARNRAKRIVRESFRQYQDKLAGYDIVVISRNGLEESDNKQLFRSLEKHWSRLVSQCKKS